MYQLIVYGLSHKTAPVDIREKLAFDLESKSDSVLKLKKLDSIQECIIISTCNRTEVYAVTDDYDSCIADIREYFISEHKLDKQIINKHFYNFSNDRAVNHLLRVSCSLDSMIVGEPQILGQVKESYRCSFDNNAVGVILNRLFQYSFFVAKKVRSMTSIGSLAVSVSYLAVELSKRIFDDLSNRTVLLVGTGEMAELAAKNLINSRIKNLFIASREFENASALSMKLNGSPIKLEEIYYKLKDTDIVITATGSNDFIFKSEHVLQALKLRKNEPMFFIDIAVPRDVDPRVNDIQSVYLYDIDDLQGVLDQNIHKRKEGANEAERIVEEHSSKFIEWINGLKVLPTIVKLKDKMENIKQSELERALGKLDSLSQDQKNVVRNLVERIMDKVLHDPISGLKRESSTSIGILYSDTIQRLYNLDKELEMIESTEDEIKDWN
ncbi:MAG: glutamyl-tRNA reductase [Thermodesulfobacteriota bacterium]